MVRAVELGEKAKGRGNNRGLALIISLQATQGGRQRIDVAEVVLAIQIGHCSSEEWDTSARGRSRTCMPLPAADFESAASANSATRAKCHGTEEFVRYLDNHDTSSR